MDASTISQRITSWGFCSKTKATLAHFVHGQTVAWTADDRRALVRGARRVFVRHLGRESKHQVPSSTAIRL